jgi:YfiH family protein
MAAQIDDAEAIGAVDAMLAQGGLQHGRRATRTRATGRPLEQTGSGAGSGAEPRTGHVPEAASASCSPGVVTVADWKRFPWLRAGFSTRQGGGSTIYNAAGADGPEREGEQNLGWTASDPAAVVAENRRKFVATVAHAAPMRLVTLRQFHSAMLRRGEGVADQLAAADGKAILRGDGLMTQQPGLLLGVQTADCVPVLIADTRTRAVAALHAGWRGTLRRIVERTVGTMRLEFGSQPQDLVAAVGPAIGPCCYSVGEEVRFEFESQFAYSPELFSDVYDSDPVREKYPMLFLTARAPGHSNLGPQIHLDLWQANRRQLLEAGVPPAAIHVVAECTACARLPEARRKYFSHRDEHGFTGRMLSVIGVAER